MPKFYGRGAWDPKLIFLQMICMQCSHYLALGILLTLFHGRNINLNQFFSYKFHLFESVNGLETSIAHIFGGIFTSFLLCYYIERAKKCFDFGLTLYFVDFLICCFYEGFPMSWSWWIVHFLSLGICIILGEYFCSLRELQEIPMLDLFTKRQLNNSMDEKHS